MSIVVLMHKSIFMDVYQCNRARSLVPPVSAESTTQKTMKNTAGGERVAAVPAAAPLPVDDAGGPAF